MSVGLSPRCRCSVGVPADGRFPLWSAATCRRFAVSEKVSSPLGGSSPTIRDHVVSQVAMQIKPLCLSKNNNSLYFTLPYTDCPVHSDGRSKKETGAGPEAESSTREHAVSQSQPTPTTRAQSARHPVGRSLTRRGRSWPRWMATEEASAEADVSAIASAKVDGAPTETNAASLSEVFDLQDRMNLPRRLTPRVIITAVFLLLLRADVRACGSC